MRTRLAALLFLLPAAGCGVVDLNAVPSAKAMCENSTEYLRQPSARMLPGRRCLECHKEDGQAFRFVWNAGGTVYSDPSSDCNVNGVEGALVELIDTKGNVVSRMTTNRSGNFFTADSIGTLPVRARVTKFGKVAEMQQFQPLPVDCASCHFPKNTVGAPGRIFIN